MLILLDIDGTLADTVPLHESALVESLKSFGFTMLPEQVISTRGFTTEKKLKLLNFPSESYEELKKEKHKVFTKLLRTSDYKTNPSLFHYFVDQGHKVVFCTQSNKKSAIEVLQVLCLPVESLYAGVNKEDPDQLLDISNSLGFSPDQTVVVDDSLAVCNSAKLAGMSTVRVEL